jgi:hypothetical protein
VYNIYNKSNRRPKMTVRSTHGRSSKNYWVGYKMTHYTFDTRNGGSISSMKKAAIKFDEALPIPENTKMGIDFYTVKKENNNFIIAKS